MVPVIYSAADVVAMPYRQDYSSVSGVVHQTAGAGKLMLCSRIAKFDEIREQVSPELVVGHDDLDGWVTALLRLLRNDAWATQMRAQIRAFAARTSWEAVGQMHLELYDAMLAGARRLPPDKSEPAHSGS